MFSGVTELNNRVNGIFTTISDIHDGAFLQSLTALTYDGVFWQK